MNLSGQSGAARVSIEDPYNKSVNKVLESLGLLVSVHYLARVNSLVTRGDFGFATANATNKEFILTLLTVLLHGALSLSSAALKTPKSTPWSELRRHSRDSILALRSVVLMIIQLLCHHLSVELPCLFRFLVIVGTMYLEDCACPTPPPPTHPPPQKPSTAVSDDMAASSTDSNSHSRRRNHGSGSGSGSSAVTSSTIPFQPELPDLHRNAINYFYR